MAEILEPGAASIKPQMDKDKAASFALNLYGLKAIKMKEFVSYDDRNYFFKLILKLTLTIRTCLFLTSIRMDIF